MILTLYQIVFRNWKSILIRWKFCRNLNTPPLYTFVLKEEALMSRSLDSLNVLMIEKTQTMQLLERLQANESAIEEMKEDINLIQKVIKVKQAEKGKE